jgi:2'-5' RNA ligase
MDALHITLKFLGEQEQTFIESFSETIEKHLSSHCPASFPLACGSLDAFPGMRRARTLVARVEGDLHALENIASLVETVSVEHGIPAERRPFVPHVTLARMRQPESLVPSDKALWDRLGWRVENITLMKSLLAPSGPVYTPLAVWNLLC